MHQPAYIFAVDGGGSKTAAALYAVDGQELARTVAGPCNLYQDPDRGLAEIARTWRQVCAQAGLDPEAAMAQTCLSAGLAGVNAPEAPERFRKAFAGFAARRLSSDGHAALVGAFGSAPGALLAIGTGVVGHRRFADGRFAMLGGWGFPIGDRGGGAWLGFRLVGDWLEHRDGFSPVAADSPLWQVVRARLGEARADSLAWLRRARPADFAALAPAIVAAADQGDAYARTLLDEAAAHLLRLVQALRPSPAEPLCLGGGLASVFAPRLAAALGHDHLAQDRMASPLTGAKLIGLGEVRAEFPEIR